MFESKAQDFRVALGGDSPNTKALWCHNTTVPLYLAQPVRHGIYGPNSPQGGMTWPDDVGEEIDQEENECGHY